MNFSTKDLVRIRKDVHTDKDEDDIVIARGTVHQIIQQYIAKDGTFYKLSNHPFWVREEYLETFTVNPEAKAFAVDFDGTLCTVAYPDIGEPIHKNIFKVKQLQEKGHYLLLWSCREGQILHDAIIWCQQRNLYFDTHNYNLPHRVQMYFDCRKLGADHYIDDLAIHPDFL